MKRRLTEDDVMAAVMGGAILGGGGGGDVANGERVARLALQIGTPELWTVDEFDDAAIATTVAYVGAPAAPNLKVTPAHFVRALELLNKALPPTLQVVAFNTNENGAETTVNGWIQSALTGLPLLDLACNGRAHPSALFGSLGLHAEPDYRSQQAYAGGHPERYVEGLACGRLDVAAAVIRQASVQAGGGVAVARNPVSIGYARRNGAPGAISHAIAVGRAWLEGGVAGAAAFMGGRIVAEGRVSACRLQQSGGLDRGTIVLDDAARTELPTINEYMLLEQGGQRIAEFPDLICTFAEDGRPLPSAEVREGMRVSVLHAPRSSLVLSRTMDMPELYAKFAASLGKPFGPRQS
ncbi:DUF917 family protein [Pelomonas sp. KK5]|uniref:S-methyl thiohydantoin desulfurase domain-containing protein n=1 Tax=Pelomonas sp. KK5 TaxID=1855730 RepID=UPI00097C57DD|nr:DUF917 family protein [Pelomonas sp. KK5]